MPLRKTDDLKRNFFQAKMGIAVGGPAPVIQQDACQRRLIRFLTAFAEMLFISANASRKLPLSAAETKVSGYRSYLELL